MRTSRFLILIPVILLSCTTKKTDYRRPENRALTIAAIPVYDGQPAVMAGSKMTTLKPMSTVYLMPGSLTAKNSRYIRVTWNDSSGYVPAGSVVRGGKEAIINTSIGQPIYVYTDKVMHNNNSSDSFMDWAPVVAGAADTSVTEITYLKNDSVKRGYVYNGFVASDSMEVVFYNAYVSAERNWSEEQPESMETLAKDRRFAGLKLPPQKFGQILKGSKPVKDFLWKNATTPGRAAVYFIFEDSSRSYINHVGYTTYNAQLFGRPASVTAIKIVFIPAARMDFTIDARLTTTYDGSTLSFTKSFADAEPGKPYFLRVDDHALGCADVDIAVTTSDGNSATGNLYSECGD